MSPKILVVDNNPKNRRLIIDTLKPYDCQIDEAASGEKAWQAISKATPDLILLDALMPIEAGLMMYRKLKDDKNLKKIPVIILTSGEKFAAIRFAELGISNFIYKSDVPANLVNEIQKFIPLVKTNS